MEFRADQVHSGSNTVASRFPEREVEGGAKEEAGPDGGLGALPPL